MDYIMKSRRCVRKEGKEIGRKGISVRALGTQ